MVQGIKNFKHWFAGFEEQYIVIGGVACELLMSEAELQFRTTKDIDVVLVVEALTPQLAERFWEYVRNAGYIHINKNTGRMQCCRFDKPQKPEYPVMIELFAGKPNILDDGCGMKIPVSISDDVSSLSAILLDKDYYNQDQSLEGILDIYAEGWDGDDDEVDCRVGESSKQYSKHLSSSASHIDSPKYYSCNCIHFIALSGGGWSDVSNLTSLKE